MKQRIPNLTVKEGSRTFTMTPAENHLHLQAMVSIRLSLSAQKKQIRPVATGFWLCL
jgi:hypothetical protein